MERTIVIKDFYNRNKHLYQDELGWGSYEKREAKSNNTKNIYDHIVGDVGLNVSFFYVGDQNFYAIFTELYPIEVKLLKYNAPDAEWLYHKRSDTNPHSTDCVTLGKYETAEDVWNNFVINGKHLEDILENSRILDVC